MLKRKEIAKKFLLLSRLTKKHVRARPVVFVVVFGIIGIVFLASTKAASPALKIEAEVGQVTGSASLSPSTGTDASASGGKSLLFGGATPKILWGIGDEPDQALHSLLHTQSPTKMITAWYNGAGDLGWMTGYRNGMGISDIYAAGNAMELVVWLAPDPQYPLTPQFQQDIASLATTFGGTVPNPNPNNLVAQHGPLYVVLFTEVETYYESNTAAYKQAHTKDEYNTALRQSYVSAVSAIHSANSQAKVALGFGGYSWYNPLPTTVIDLSFWNSAISASDFTAVQEMHACNNEVNGQSILVPQIRSSVKQLGSYGKPVMISHFQMFPATGTPAGCERDGFAKFEQEMFTDASLKQLVDYGLFAWVFMGSSGPEYDNYVANPGPNFDYLKNFITGHASPGIGFP